MSYKTYLRVERQCIAVCQCPVPPSTSHRPLPVSAKTHPKDTHAPGSAACGCTTTGYTEYTCVQWRRTIPRTVCTRTSLAVRCQDGVLKRECIYLEFSIDLFAICILIYFCGTAVFWRRLLHTLRFDACRSPESSREEQPRQTPQSCRGLLPGTYVFTLLPD